MTESEGEAIQRAEEELERLKNDPVLFCKAVGITDIQPWQEEVIRLAAERPLKIGVDPMRGGKRFYHEAMKRMAEAQGFRVVRPAPKRRGKG